MKKIYLILIALYVFAASQAQYTRWFWNAGVDSTLIIQEIGAVPDSLTGYGKIFYYDDTLRFLSSDSVLFNITPVSGSGTGFVPYTGATANVDLGVYTLTASSISANLKVPNGTDILIGNAGSTSSWARFYYNSGAEYVALKYNGNEKLTTNSGGVSVIGNMGATTFSGQTIQLTTGATDGYYLQSDALGNASWAAISGGTPGGSSTQIQYNNAGAFGGMTGYTYDGTNYNISDSYKINFGAGLDLVAYSNGSRGILETYNGGRIELKSSIGEYMATFVTNGAVNLYYNNTLTLNTSSTGITVAGTVSSGIGAFSSYATVADEAYGVGWNGSNRVPTKNALYDKIESLPSGANYWDRTGTTLSPATSGDDLDMTGGDITIGSSDRFYINTAYFSTYIGNGVNLNGSLIASSDIAAEGNGYFFDITGNDWIGGTSASIYTIINSTTRLEVDTGGIDVTGETTSSTGFTSGTSEGVNSDTFTNGDGDIVTVTGGLITAINPPPPIPSASISKFANSELIVELVLTFLIICIIILFVIVMSNRKRIDELEDKVRNL